MLSEGASPPDELSEPQTAMVPVDAPESATFSFKHNKLITGESPRAEGRQHYLTSTLMKSNTSVEKIGK